jgi:hypothetical protein
MAAKNLGRTWSLAVALLLCAATVVMMGAYGGSEKVYVDREVVKYGGSSISATNAVSMAATASVYTDAFSLEKSSCFSILITITNSTSAAGTINLQVYDQGALTWVNRYSTAGVADPFVVMSDTPAGTMWISITSLPVGQMFRFKVNKDSGDKVFKITRLVVLHQ